MFEMLVTGGQHYLRGIKDVALLEEVFPLSVGLAFQMPKPDPCLNLSATWKDTCRTDLDVKLSTSPAS